MKKDIVISILGAVIISRYQWLQAGSHAQIIMAIIGIATILFIFLLFLEETSEKIKKHRKRIQKIKKRVGHLRSIKL